jgi:hypothetical protein
MLGLKLRDEFCGAHMTGTAIELRRSDNQGAAQKSADHILSITYPTADVQTALRAVSTKKNGSPIVLMGGRGRGKSHIMAVMHHAIQSPDTVEGWLKDWGSRLGSGELQAFEMVKGFVPISEPVHNHEYPLLWNLLFARHPKGDYFRGQFEALGQPFPPRSLLEKMFEDQPICLIFDEFQKWFDGLHNEPEDGIKYRTWAENFIQILSELATDRPEILILAISVLDNRTDAFQQVHRQGPVIVDFRGPSAKEDRQRLLLHRLFENRNNIPEVDIESMAGVYGSERFRLLYPNKSDAEKERVQQETVACWPFTPELLNLLEDHILLSSAAQETRDLIRILAQVFRSRSDEVPVITPSDFRIDGESDEVQTLVDSIAVQAGQEKLRQIAQRNLQEVRDSGIDAPNARELISAIWMRSMSPGKISGGSPAELHLDITRSAPIDDNAFQAELALLIENSVNIHGDEVPGGPLRFAVNENPRSKVRASAKNNKLWSEGAVSTAGLTVYPGKDIAHIRKTLRHIFVPDTTQPPSRVIVLGPNWQDDPWSDVDESDKPAKWDRPVLLVVPDQIAGGQAVISAALGAWLATKVPKRRNTIRFLLLANEAADDLYRDDEIIFLARCSFLCSGEGWGSDMTYRTLHQDFDRPLRQVLKSRFSRFAVLHTWDFQQPQRCVFDIETPRVNKQGTEVLAQGEDIPVGVEATILKSLFDQTAFKAFVLKRAKDSDFVGSLMDDLTEPPPPNGGDAIPFLGETKTYEAILNIAATGQLVLSVNGTWVGRRPEDTTEEDALRHIRSKAFRAGQEMRQIQLGLPGVVGGSTVTAPKAPPPGEGAVSPEGTKPGSTSSAVGGPSPSPGGESGGGVAGGVGGVSPETVPQAVKSRKSDEPTSAINLSGCFETWGVMSSQTIESARIEFRGLTAQQIKQILQRVPSTFKATLEITYNDGDE